MADATPTAGRKRKPAKPSPPPANPDDWLRTAFITWQCQKCGWANDNNAGPCRKCGAA